MAPPLAGKPPFATDEPDSFYDGSPSPTKRRVPPPKPDNPNKRSSAYDVYDNYLAPGENPASSSNGQRPTSAISTATSRNSGIGGIGLGLLAMDSDDDDDSDDEAYERKRKADKEKREREAAAASSGQQSKNAALAAAVANGGKPSSPSSSMPSAPNPNSNLNPNAIAPPPSQRSPPPIAAPRPGYAAPAFAQLDSGFGKSPSPVENPFEPSSQPPPPQQQGGMPPPPHMRGPPGPGGPPGPQPRGPPGINMNLMNGLPNGGPRQPPPVHPAGGPMPPPNAIVRGMTPAPLAPPMTPILPVFAVGPKSTPSPSPGPEGNDKEGAGGIKWDDLPTPIPRKPIMRSNTEDALLPRRGEKGDDFWRRFSMIAKVDMAEKSKGGKGSSWLRRTENGKQRLSRWVWVIGMILLCAIGGAIGLGVYFTRDSPDHQQPEALAGKVGNQTAGAVTTTASVVSFGGGRGGGGGTPSTSRLHVSPTHTIEGRGFVLPVVPTPATTPTTDTTVEKREHAMEEHHRRSAQRKRRF